MLRLAKVAALLLACGVLAFTVLGCSKNDPIDPVGNEDPTPATCSDSLR